MSAMARFPWVWSLLAFGLTVSLVPLTKLLAVRWSIIDQPEARKWHRRPTPRLGGLAVFVAVFFLAGAWFVFREIWLKQGAGIVLAGALLWFLGTLDDAQRLHPQVKLWIGMPVAACILYFSGVRVQLWNYAWLNFLTTLIWVMGIVSAFNLLDNMDGLCAGIAAIAAFFFTVLAFMFEQYLVMTFGALITGAACGFLVYNYPPASIFLGDGGALFLGAMMAALGLKVDFLLLPKTVSWIVPILILGVPIYDTTLVIFSRLRRGLVPFSSPGKDHFSHRLYSLGLTAKQVAWVHYGLSIFLGSLATLFVWKFHEWPSLLWILIFGSLILIGSFGFFLLERAPFQH